MIHGRCLKDVQPITTHLINVPCVHGDGSKLMANATLLTINAKHGTKMQIVLLAIGAGMSKMESVFSITAKMKIMMVKMAQMAPLGSKVKILTVKSLWMVNVSNATLISG